MSVGAAFRFVQHARADATIRARIDALGDAATLADLVAIGDAAGMRFDASELRAAHRHDWGMRFAASTRADTGSSAR